LRRERMKCSSPGSHTPIRWSMQSSIRRAERHASPLQA